MRPSEAAWGAVTAGVIAYEMFAPEDELMTHQAHRWLSHESRVVRAGTRFVLGATALHLLALTPPPLDPFTYIGKAAGWITER